MSAEHAKIICVKDSSSPLGYTVTITDCSRNGLWVNGVKLVKGEPNFLKDGDLIDFPFQCVFKFRVNEGVEPKYGTPKHRLKKGEKSAAASKKKKEEVGTAPPPKKAAKKEEEAKEVVLPVPAAKKRASPEKENVEQKGEEEEKNEEGKDAETGLPLPPSKKGKSVWASKTAPDEEQLQEEGKEEEEEKEQQQQQQVLVESNENLANVTALEEEIANLRKSNETVSRERDEFAAMNKKLKTKVKEAEEKDAGTTKAFEAFKAESKEEMEDLDKVIERLTEGNGEKTKEIEEAHAKINSMEEEVTEMKAAIAKHTEEYASMETNLKELTQRLETSEKELDEAKSSLEANKDAIERAEKAEENEKAAREECVKYQKISTKASKELNDWADVIGKSETLQANLEEAVKAKEASEKELATMKETLAVSRAAFVEAQKALVLVGERLHVSSDEEEEDDVKVDETMEMDKDDNQTHTTSEEETENGDFHATQVAPPVNEDEEDEKEEEEEEDVNGGEEHNEQQAAASAEAFDPQTQDCVDIEFPATEVQEPAKEDEEEQMQTPAKDDASEENEEERDDMEAKYASMMKQMTPAPEEAAVVVAAAAACAACDEEEPKEEQEDEELVRSTPIAQALVENAVANIIAADDMVGDDVRKASLPTPFENNKGLGFTEGDEDEEKANEKEEEEEEEEKEEEEEEEDLTLCGEDFVEKTEEIPKSALNKAKHFRFPQTPLSPKHLVVEGEENTPASSEGKTFEEGGEKEASQKRSPLATHSPIVLD